MAIAYNFLWTYAVVVAEITPIALTNISYRYSIVRGACNAAIAIAVYLFFRGKMSLSLEQIDRFFVETTGYLDCVKVAERIRKRAVQPTMRLKLWRLMRLRRKSGRRNEGSTLRYTTCIYNLDPTVLVLGIERSMVLTTIGQALHDVRIMPVMFEENIIRDTLNGIDHLLEEFDLHRAAILQNSQRFANLKDHCRKRTTLYTMSGEEEPRV